MSNFNENFDNDFQVERDVNDIQSMYALTLPFFYFLNLNTFDINFFALFCSYL